MSFGTRPVPKIAKIEELNNPINLDAKAFLPHLLPAVFVSDKTMAFHLGHTEVEHLKQYLDTQAPTFYQLLQGDSPTQSQASSVSSQGTASSVAQASTFIAHTSTVSNPQTMVMHTSSTSGSQNGTLIINSLSQSQMQSTNGTRVIRPVSQSPTTTVFINSVTTSSTLDNNTLVINNSVSKKTQPSRAIPAPVNKIANLRPTFFNPKSIPDTVQQGDRLSTSHSSKSFKS